MSLLVRGALPDKQAENTRSLDFARDDSGMEAPGLWAMHWDRVLLRLGKRGQKEPQSRAGWPGFPIVELVRRPVQTGKPECLNLGCHRVLLLSRLRNLAQQLRFRFKVFNSKAELLNLLYITIARFSNSCWRTGIAQPAISTRPAASRAAVGETPYPRPIRNTRSNSAAS